MSNRGQARGGPRGGRSSTSMGGQARGSPRGGRFSTSRGGQARGNPRGGRYSPLAAFHPPDRHSPQAGNGTRGTFSSDSSGNNEFSSNSDMESSQQVPLSTLSYHSEHKPDNSSARRQEWRPSGRKDVHSNDESLEEHKSIASRGVSSKDSKWSVAPDSSYGGHPPSFSNLSHSGNLHMGVERMQIRETPSEMTADNVTLPCKSEAHGVCFPIISPVNATNHGKLEPSEHPTFDLCPTKSGASVTLKAPLLVQNRERRNEIKRSMEPKSGSVLQTGMILLKSYLSLSDQIHIVKSCRDLGLGPGGFYQPGYRDGAKLNLKMMCLGKNWDPETSQYGDHRPFDGSKPPKIPVEFFQLVKSAIEESHSCIRKDSKTSNSEGILPWMTPDICLVNFYSSSGRLGLHQDRDESEQSLRKCLPVVSFSIGDAAEFLYGEQRDVDRANKVTLESGDVLIFGGESRHVFHGVSSIKPNTAPKTLLEKTNLRPGRLNLTFREY